MWDTTCVDWYPSSLGHQIRAVQRPIQLRISKGTLCKTCTLFKILPRARQSLQTSGWRLRVQWSNGIAQTTTLGHKWQLTLLTSDTDSNFEIEKPNGWKRDGMEIKFSQNSQMKFERREGGREIAVPFRRFIRLSIVCSSRLFYLYCIDVFRSYSHSIAIALLPQIPISLDAKRFHSINFALVFTVNIVCGSFKSIKN